MSPIDIIIARTPCQSNAINHCNNQVGSSRRGLDHLKPLHITSHGGLGFRYRIHGKVKAWAIWELVDVMFCIHFAQDKSIFSQPLLLIATKVEHVVGYRIVHGRERRRVISNKRIGMAKVSHGCRWLAHHLLIQHWRR